MSSSPSKDNGDQAPAQAPPAASNAPAATAAVPSNSSAAAAAPVPAGTVLPPTKPSSSVDSPATTVSFAAGVPARSSRRATTDDDPSLSNPGSSKRGRIGSLHAIAELNEQVTFKGPKFDGANTSSQRSVVRSRRAASSLVLGKPANPAAAAAAAAEATKNTDGANADVEAPPAVDVAGTEGKEYADLTIAEALAKLEVTVQDGLSDEEVAKRIEEYGPNALPEVAENKCLKFLSFMWNPLSWVMEAAAIVAIALANGPTPWLCTEDSPADCKTINRAPDYPDFVGIVLLLILNSAIGYYEETAAGDAVAALMGKLQKECRVKRNGKWSNVLASALVPGDIIIIKLGDIIPADCKLLEGESMRIDQAALTGESLPVKRDPGDEVYSGSTVKQGEIEALVFATGINSFLGRAANLVQTTETHGHLQQVLTQIGMFCLIYICIWIIILCAILYGDYRWDYRRGIDQILVALIGGVPIAMPTVLSVTMALGVNELATHNAVVTRITAVEELAGMDILCSDKTGTLTLNKLSLREPSVVLPFTDEDIKLAAVLASRLEGDPDAIDRCIGEDTADLHEEIVRRYEVLKFYPFDPIAKRTIAWVLDRDTQKKFLVTKGAPQKIIDIVVDADEIRDEENEIIDRYAQAGLRALAVARSDTEITNGHNLMESEEIEWTYMGLLSLNDPPRPDTKQTIEDAMALGVRVIMITGDQIAIGKETARELGMGLNFHAAHVLDKSLHDGVPIKDIIEEAQGWGEVMPQHKYQVVKQLHDNGHLVGMTGDGVNDAPALKVADVGIAVAGATDAARSASDMVLLTDGLSVIITAILGSRRIFQRMRNYATYACATTVRIVTTFGILATAWEFSFPPFLVLIIAVLNDGTIMTVSTDNVKPSKNPDKWALKSIFIMAIALGLYLTASSLVFYYVINSTTWCEDTFKLRPLHYNKTHPTDEESFMMAGVVYLQVSITGQLVIFSTRTQTFFFLDKPSNFLMGAFVVAQLVATFIAVYADWGFTQLHGIGWGWAGFAWVWSLVWTVPLDLPKFAVQYFLERKKPYFPGLGAGRNINGGATHLGTRGNARARRDSVMKAVTAVQ